MTRDAIIADLRTLGENIEISSRERTVCDLAASLIENQEKKLDALTLDCMARRELLERQWTSVEEKLPTDFKSVLGYIPEEAPFPTVHECYHAPDGWYAHSFHGSVEVTHWMPMPRFEEDEDGE